MSVSHITVLPLLALVLGPIAGCASGVPGTASSPRVMLVQDDEFVLTGTTDPQLAQGTCVAGTPKHLLRLIEPTKAKLTLRGTNGAAPLDSAVMSLTNIESKQTLCVAMNHDTPAVLPAELSVGTYAISVNGTVTDQPRRYEILWEQR
jgi:hypothetical protein